MAVRCRASRSLSDLLAPVVHGLGCLDEPGEFPSQAVAGAGLRTCPPRAGVVGGQGDGLVRLREVVVPGRLGAGDVVRRPGGPSPVCFRSVHR